ncbi:MAG: hypothetical protein SGBAC_013121, partial [Bacillariaceae sp.]
MEIRAKSEYACQILKAATEGDMEFLKSVSDHELTTSYCSSGCTALHWAGGTNQVKALQYFILERNLSPDILAVKKSKGRTPLHYACRNGAKEATRFLVEKCQATVNHRAKHGVSPFQLAVWQNQLSICRYLVEECGVDPCQVNDFDCGAIHWLGICPTNRANSSATAAAADEDENENGSHTEYDDCATTFHDGRDLLPLAKWLAEQPGVDYAAKQRQGHSALHKAAWGGHLALLRYLRNEHGLWDDSVDDAGNYAADLADMANTPRHTKIAKYLREECSRDRAESCAVLEVDPSASPLKIRQAYLSKAREFHPDRNVVGDEGVANHFDAVHKAYIHLTEHQGHGTQSNPAHSLKLMLQVSGLNEDTKIAPRTDGVSTTITNRQEDKCFKARLIAVLLEYGDKGLDLSNVKRKWKQVWPKDPFPEIPIQGSKNKKMPLSTFIQKQAGDVVDLVQDGSGIRVKPKNCSQEKVVIALQSGITNN